jgi:hypothetical protein
MFGRSARTLAWVAFGLSGLGFLTTAARLGFGLETWTALTWTGALTGLKSSARGTSSRCAGTGP